MPEFQADFRDIWRQTIKGDAVAFKVTKTIALVGLMGSGKTAVGTLVAEKLGVRFVDSDAEIVKAANMSIAEIFNRDGEAFFRAKETQVLERLMQGAPCILSTGGGAYLAEQNRQAISDQGVALWLRADLAVLWARVKHKTTRPLLQTDNPRQTLSDLLDARAPLYALAELAVISEKKLSLIDMTDKVVAALLAAPKSGVTQG